MQTEAYSDEQQLLAKHLGAQLSLTAGRLREAMCDHAIATALIGIGVETALRSMPPAELAEWLQAIADEIVRPEFGTHGTA